MRLLISIAFLGCLFLGSSEAAFINSFRERCFTGEGFSGRDQLVAGQTLPRGFSLNVFINLLQRLEEANDGKYAEDMAKYLVDLFVYEDYTYSPTHNTQEKGTIGPARNVLVREQLFNKLPSNNLNDDDSDKKELERLRTQFSFSDDELCYLAVGLSHTVYNDRNRTYEYGTFQPFNFKTNNGRESNVSLSKVLLGIAFSGVNSASWQDIRKPLSIQVKLPDDINLGTSVDFAAALTISDAMGTAAGRYADVMGNDRSNYVFLANGPNAPPGCPTRLLLKYFSETNSNDARKIIDPMTAAVLAGANDGYVLAEAIRADPSIKDNKLSQLLRAYYSSGVYTSSGTLASCERKLQDVDNRVAAQTLNYISLQVAVNAKEKQDRDNARGAVNTALGNFRNVGCHGTSDTDLPCDTLANVLVIFDNTMTGVQEENLKKQADIANYLTDSMYFRRGVSDLRVYSRDGTSDSLRESTPSKAGCPGCVLAYRHKGDNPISTSSSSDPMVFDRLRRTLDKLNETNSTSSASAARVVLYFKFGQKDRNEAETINALNRLSSHQEAKLFAFGDEGPLETYRKSARFSGILSIQNGYTSEQLRSIKKQICSAPALLQYPDCARGYSRDNDEKSLFKGYVSPGTVQYFAFYPLYFHGSKNLYIKFSLGESAVGGIKVCPVKSENVADGSIPTADCRQIDTATDGSNGTAEFYYESPCKNGPYSCYPLTYAVIGTVEGTPTFNIQPQDCAKEPFCQHRYQIPFEVRHDGMTCKPRVQLTTQEPTPTDSPTTATIPSTTNSPKPKPKFLYMFQEYKKSIIFMENKK